MHWKENTNCRKDDEVLPLVVWTCVEETCKSTCKVDRSDGGYSNS